MKIRGSQVRWDTQKPERSVLLINEREAKIYYPDQGILEIYTLDRRLGELAASLLPRLELLGRKFSFEQIPASDMEEKADPKGFLALRLMPTDAMLSEHVRQVRVLLDVNAAHIVKAEVTDSDGELRKDWRMTQGQVTGDHDCSEQIVAPGEQVTAIGRYAADKGGLVQDIGGGHQLRLIRGDAHMSSSALGKQATGSIVGAIIAIPAAAVLQVTFEEIFVERRERRHDLGRAGTLIKRRD